MPSPVIRVTLIALFVATVLTPAPSNAAECSRGPDPFVRLDVDSGEVRYIETANRTRLRRMHGRHVRPVDGWEPIGLTLAELGLSIVVSVRSELMEDGRFCSTLNAVEATIGYDVIDVYIAREYRRGSCQYAVILDHERRHVVVFQSTLDEYLPELQSLIEMTASRVRPIAGRDRNRAARQMQTELQNTVKELLEEISETLDRRNARLDTDDQYRVEQKQCLNW